MGWELLVEKRVGAKRVRVVLRDWIFDVTDGVLFLADKFGFVGVAPNASLLHYKVFPCSGGVSTDVGVNASLRAFEEGVDVINASIGGQGGWSKGE